MREKASLFSLYFIIIISFFSIIGHVLQIPKIKSIGFMTAASPLPLVFSHFRSFETFANDFELSFIDKNGNNIKHRRDAQEKENVGGGAQGVAVAFMGTAFGGAFFLAADNGDKKAAPDKWQAHADIDRMAEPFSFIRRLMDGLFLFHR